MLDPENQRVQNSPKQLTTEGDSSIQRSLTEREPLQSEAIDLSNTRIERNPEIEKRGPGVEDFRAITSYDELHALYEAQGKTFESVEELFDQVKKDWYEERVRLFKETIDLPLPDTFPSCSVEINGQQHTIVGCIHSPAVGEDYYRLLLSTIGKSPWWTHEQNLGTAGLFIPGLERVSIEIDDHNVRGLGRRILHDFKAMWTQPFRSIKFSLFNKRLAETARQEGKSEHFLYEQFLHLPFDSPLELPAHLDIIRRETLGLGYTLTQVRSAYQAAFFKTWDPEQVNSVTHEVKQRSNFPEQSWNEKNILVGAAHAHEIEYFLTHEPKFERAAIERATRDAELYNKDPQAFFRRRNLRDATQKVGSLGLSIASGYGGMTLFIEAVKLFT